MRSPEFLRAAEALTGAPISVGDDVQLLINGDQIFPCYLDTIRAAAGDGLPDSRTSTGAARSRTTSPTRCASARAAGSSAT